MHGKNKYTLKVKLNVLVLTDQAHQSITIIRLCRVLFWFMY